MIRLDGKVALITGAASGIGAASARLLADAGAAVAGLDVEECATELALRGDEVSDLERRRYFEWA